MRFLETAELRPEGFDVRDEDVARLSPLGHGHLNVLGRYASRFPSSSHAANCVRCAVLESCLMTMFESRQLTLVGSDGKSLP
jgi:Tn3 transposase DDE domain